MLYCYSQRHVHKVFIFITIRGREATLMIIIASSPGNRSSQITHSNDCRAMKGEGKTPKTWCISSSPSSPKNYGDMCFLFLTLDDKIPKFTCVKFEKNWHQVKERLTSTCIRQVISKPSNTVILYYLALNAFHVGFFKWNKFYFSQNNYSERFFAILNRFWAWYRDLLFWLLSGTQQNATPRILQK